MKILELNNVEFHYPGSEFRLANINLTFNENDFAFILGPNGSGKSTLFKLILGSKKPDKGTIKLKSKNVFEYSDKERAKNIAYVPQSSLTVYPYSIYEIVMMGRTPYFNFTGFERKRDMEIVDEALETVGLYGLRNKGINEVSGGEAQRAFIARALAQKSDLILLDEPTAHLDLKHQYSIIKLLRKLNEEQGLTIISIIHDLNLAGNFNGRAILMKNGKVFADDKIEKILISERIKEVFDVDSEVSTKTLDSGKKIFIHILDKQKF